MEINTIILWRPTSDVLSEQLYIDKILDDHTGLNIVARNQGSKNYYEFIFNRVLFFQNIDETCSLARLEKYPILSTVTPLFLCLNSSYSSWLYEQSYQVISIANLQHYIITHGDGIIDIVTEVDPIVKYHEIN